VDPQTAYPKSGYQTSDNYGGYNVQTIRGKLLWNASDKLTVTFTADWTHQDQTALPYTVLGSYSGNLATSTFSTLYNLCISNNAASRRRHPGCNGGPPPVFANASLVNQCRISRTRSGTLDGGAALLGAGYVGGPPGRSMPPTSRPDCRTSVRTPRAVFRLLCSDEHGQYRHDLCQRSGLRALRYFGGSVTAAYESDDEMTLKSISGYRQIKWLIGTDLDGTPGDLQEVTDHQHQWQVSQEFQLLGKEFDDRLNYVTGLYYFEEAGYVHDFVPFESLLYVYDFQNDVNNKNEAAFFHADYKLTDKSASPPAAATPMCRKSSSAARETSTTSPVGGTPLRYFPPGDNSQSWHIFDPTVGAQYHINSDVMAYLSWGKGFKAGGWTTRLSSPITNADQAQFSPEYTKTWELGLKSTWFEQRLRANAASVLHRLRRHPAQHSAGYLTGVHQRRQCEDQGRRTGVAVDRGPRPVAQLLRLVHRCLLHVREPERQHPAIHIAGWHDGLPRYGGNDRPGDLRREIRW
jgi:iron complex outermembrane receptor protein